MIKYEFDFKYVDGDPVIECHKSSTYYQERRLIDAFEVVDTLDKKKYKDFRLRNNYVAAKTNSIIVIINNFEEFINHKHFSNLNEQVKLEILKRYVKKKVKNISTKVINTVFSKKGAIAIGAVMMGLLLVKAPEKVGTLPVNPINIDLPIDTDDQPFDEEILIDIKEVTEQVKALESNEHEEVALVENTLAVVPEQSSEYINPYGCEIELTPFDCETYNEATQRHGEMVNDIATEWGIDPNIIMGILTLESGGRGNNVMQVTYSDWLGTTFNSYNFKTEKREKIIFTDDPNIQTNENQQVIRSTDMSDPYYNITIGSLIYRKCLEYANYQIIPAILLYNQGYGNFDKIMSYTANATGYSVQELLSDSNHLEYANYGFASGVGDPYYLQDTLRYIIPDLDLNQENIWIYRVNDEGISKVTIPIEMIKKQKNHSL